MSYRIDSSQLNSDQQIALQQLLEASPKPFLSDGKGKQIELPDAIFSLMVRVMSELKAGNSFVLVPENEQFTTQAAANYLGMPRQHVVSLLEGGTIPFHKVGSHRRVRFKDILEYQKNRDSERKKALDDFYVVVDEKGAYDTSEEK